MADFKQRSTLPDNEKRLSQNRQSYTNVIQDTINCIIRGGGYYPSVLATLDKWNGDDGEYKHLAQESKSYNEYTINDYIYYDYTFR